MVQEWRVHGTVNDLEEEKAVLTVRTFRVLYYSSTLLLPVSRFRHQRGFKYLTQGG